MNVLDVAHLEVTHPGHGHDSWLTTVRDVSFRVAAGESLGVVGESGSGKSQTMLAVLGMLGRGGARVSGRVEFDGTDLTALSQKQLRAVRGSGIGLVSQDALSALNPAMTIGKQMAEPLIRYDGHNRRSAADRCTELLQLVGIPAARERLRAYPHQLSGGMRQRVLIAMAISREPKLLIADEPTTALDVSIQSQVLRLIDRLRRELDMALVLITHDLGVVAGVTDRIAVMYGGMIVETASTAELFDAPGHPYTRALMQSVPRMDRKPGDRLPAIPGLPPHPSAPPPGCAFQPRCALARSECGDGVPVLAQPEPVRAGHLVRCPVNVPVPTGGAGS
ncbi:ABC transporter ATP-binding protein [Streptomyces sp. CMB-StM0423]|uniref:ABC transporter ATP-binding protein n=1 Tax=Streptomyces sp. CMB-StM0423 TaxID=2059884 RepID=UPI000C711FC3|nr:ABC transporter ATP-binding protein [Streptomyces sp. CMB-StM0423]AUH40843.1 methionine ABC transporter ATP-binding protein [Streptomyces sp. CMB-StM0423]